MTSPTIGSNVEEMTFKNIHFTMWDVGGQRTFTPANPICSHPTVCSRRRHESGHRGALLCSAPITPSLDSFPLTSPNYALMMDWGAF